MPPQNPSPMAPDTLRALIATWESRDGDTWPADDYLVLGKKAIGLGQPSLAYDILNEATSRFPKRPDIAYLAALALARGGSVGAATQAVDSLLARAELDDKTTVDALSLAGRLAKDRWTRLPDGAAKRAAGERSVKLYGEAFRRLGDYFPGINAATMSRLIGNADESRALAKEVSGLCREAEGNADAADYWLSATLGEACLLLGEFAEAGDCYAKATKRAKANVGDIASMRRQVKLLSSCVDIPPSVMAALHVPNVVAFTGHMIDAPDRLEPRFPPGLADRVSAAIAEALSRVDAGIGYASAACGGDILFLEEIGRRGAESNVILPFEREDFVAISVAFAGEEWVKRFDRALAGADRVRYAISEGYQGDDLLFTYGADVIQGTARLRAQQLAIEPVLLALIDGRGPEKIGGTAETVRHWRESGGRVEIIDLAAIRASVAPGAVGGGRAEAVSAGPGVSSPPPGSGPLTRAWGKRKRKTMLFADVVGFSKLREQDSPTFLVEFLGRIAEVIEATTKSPSFQNTWGDGLFVAFDDIIAASDFALRLRDTVVTTDWSKRGLPAGTSIRIGMHTGPVYPGRDPIINRENYFGSHVNRAARIEPVTQPGAVYVSEQTAALLEVSGTEEFACDYIGETPLAKSFGTSALYRLRRRSEVD